MKEFLLKCYLKAFVCFLFVSLSMVPGMVHATRLDLGSVSGCRGSDVTIPITLNYEGATPDIAGTSNDIGFDTSVLENPRAVIGPAGNAAGKMVVSNLVSAGLFRVGVIGLNQNIIQNGTVANVTFGIKAGVPTGDTNLGNTPSASDRNGVAVPVQANPGTVHITTLETISTPQAPSGPASGGVGTPYAYWTSGCTSSLGYSVEY